MSHRLIKHQMPFETATMHLPSCPLGSGTKRISEIAELGFACQSTRPLGVYPSGWDPERRRRSRSRASRVVASNSGADI